MLVVGLDIALHLLLKDPLASSVGIAKEGVFVLVSTGVVWLCIRRFRREWQLAQGEADAADHALRESERRYRLLVERVPGVVWLDEVDGTIRNERIASTLPRSSRSSWATSRTSG